MPRPLRRALTAVHVAIFRATGGRALGSIDGLPVLLLTTVGRTSGKRRTMPLMYVEDDGALAVAASYSNDHNPGWYHNVVATPAVEVRSRASVQTMRAALVDGRDRRRICDRFATQSKQYARYERNTDRVIPVVLLRPLEQDARATGRPEAA